jgi:hypothetical protein
MRRLSDALSEDTNQFGPGTDLMVSLLAVLLVMTLITAYLYRVEADKVVLWTRLENDHRAQIDRMRKELREHEARGGNFRLASDSFSAADFRPLPVTELVDRRGTSARVARIIGEYRRIGSKYPYIFVIGHSSMLDDPRAADAGTEARRQRNWVYAARRAAVIAGLMQEHLDEAALQRVVVVTTGELDLKRPKEPLSQDNAWVEVVFGKEWSLPGRNGE